MREKACESTEIRSNESRKKDEDGMDIYLVNVARGEAEVVEVALLAGSMVEGVRR
jgi:hypothetical protein